MEKEQLEREPNPQPIPPVPGGAFDQSLRIKLGAGAVFVVLLAMLAFFFLSRNPVAPVQTQPKQALVDEQQVQRKEAEARQLASERAKAHDAEEAQRRHDLEAYSQPVSYQQAAATGGGMAPQQSAATQQKEELAKLEAKAAFEDNMVLVTERKQDVRNSTLPMVRDSGSNPPSSPSGATGESVGGDKLVRLGAQRLPEGTIIECALVNQLNGDNTGPVMVQVSNDVYLPGTRTLVIPQGARILGSAQKVSAQNQQRLAVSFHRMLIGTTPERMYTVSLDKIPGLDQTGAAALQDKVNNHYAQIFGASLAIGAIGGLAQIGNGGYGGANGYDSGVMFRNGITQSMAQSSAQILNRFLSRLPTIVIRPGTRVDIFLTQDLELPAYGE